MTDNDRLTGLINRIRAGDGEAAGELVAEYGDEVKAAIRHILGRGNPLGRLVDPSDILQSVMVRLLRGSDAIPSQVENGRAFLVSMARHRVIDHGRKQAALKWSQSREDGGLETAANVLDPSPSPSGELIRKEEVEAILKALTPPERLVAEGLLADKTWAEIASGTGTKPGTLEKRFHRTMKLLTQPLCGAAYDGRFRSAR